MVRPILNPVLTLRQTPMQKKASGGGKSRKHINPDRLDQQRVVLSDQLEGIYASRKKRILHENRLPLVVKMFDDKWAASWAPKDFFPIEDAQLVSPWMGGYLVEVHVNKLPKLALNARNNNTVAGKVDIGNIEDISEHSLKDVFRNKTVKSVWDVAPKVEGGRLFNLSFMPFQTSGARQSVIEHLKEQCASEIFFSIDTRKSDVSLTDKEQNSSLSAGFREYKNSVFGRANVVIPSEKHLKLLALSGSASRISPVNPISTTQPGIGKEPEPSSLPAIDTDPIVGVIDGGLTASRYEDAVAWRHSAYIKKVTDADTPHGNQVSSLVVHGHEWNNNLDLPELNCRIGVVQAIAKEKLLNLSHDSFITYLDDVFRSHPEVKVWNMSFNEDICCEMDSMSQLGHEISELARKHNVLPVISAGNVYGSQTRLFPPADSEAGLTVSGRRHNENGRPSKPCQVSSSGPGPDGLLKPEISWFSTVRKLGGSTDTATSWSAPLISSLAAHTCQRLKIPNPDIVKALLINRCDRDKFCDQRGWGSPNIEYLPWQCPNNQITLAWSSHLKAGQDYYWEDIPIPESLTKDGGLFGYGAMTAIINPTGLVSESRENYFSCRLETALQYKNAKNDENKNLLGSLAVSREKEDIARKEYDKWNPVRHHSRDFTNKPLVYSGNTLQIRARIFARDTYQYGYFRNEDIPAVPVSFVVTLQSAEENADLYNEMRVSLGSFVENAVIEQDIDIDI